jgi:hypothetical protein
MSGVTATTPFIRRTLAACVLLMRTTIPFSVTLKRRSMRAPRAALRILAATAVCELASRFR